MCTIVVVRSGSSRALEFPRADIIAGFPMQSER
jgi:hypothetical protein